MTSTAQTAPIDRAVAFELFADLMDYPGDAEASALQRAASILAPDSPVLSTLVNDFITRAQAMPRTQLEEIYAGVFDLRPDCTLNLGHHLFPEDNGKRSGLLIELASAAKDAGLNLGGELPDYLPWMLRLLARVPDDSELLELIPCCVLPGLRSLSQHLPSDYLYQPLVHALFFLVAERPLTEETA